MKNLFRVIILLAFLQGTAAIAQNSVLADGSRLVNFEFSPPEWQTAICLPDDPHKTLVDRSGELLYHYRQGGREFGTRIGIEVAGTEKWISQDLYSPRVPIVRTNSESNDLKITKEAFALVDTRPAREEANSLMRTDPGDILLNWANPSDPVDPTLRNINVHMGGSINYELKVPAGAGRCVALALCEGYWGEAGQRIQVLLVEGCEKRIVDLVAAQGKNRPAAFWFDATDSNSDGKITIAVEAAPQTKDSNTILNGLWIFNSGTAHQDSELLTGKLNSKALAGMHHTNYYGPGRNDIVLVTVMNSGTQEQIFDPQLIINTALPFSYDADQQKMVVRNMEIITTSLNIKDIREGENGLYTFQLSPLKVQPGKTAEFFIQFKNGSSKEGFSPENDPKTMEQVLACRDKAINFWEKNSPLPFGRIQVPDPGIQALLESSIRNIWQAREVKQGLPVFQVGPTCYRGLWIVDGAFLLESAAMLGAGEEARNGVAYELTLQKPDGRIESLAPDFWKENGIVLWTCVRHAQLSQDKAWLESVWPKLQLIAEYIKTLRRQTLQNESPLDDGLNPAGTLDGGIGGTHDEYTNSYWNLTGLKAFVQGAEWLGKTEEADAWQKEYDDFMNAFQQAEQRDLSKDPYGNSYLPILLGPAGREQLPQRAQWAFCQAVYPGQIFRADDPMVKGNLAMLEATEREGMVYGTGWDATGIWNYFASFYGHAWLWQGRGEKAAQALYAFGNHASPTLVWREEQSLKGNPFRKVGDMPHNWASAEFIRLAIHLIALDRGNELHLFEGLPPEWTQPGMVTQLNGIATPFGPLTLRLTVQADGRNASLHIEPLSDASCQNIIVHLKGWTGTEEGKLISLVPGKSNDVKIPITR